MLTTYQTKITNNHIDWLDIPLKLDNTMVAITILLMVVHKKIPLQLSEKLRNSVKIMGDFDIINTSELSAEWSSSL